MLAPVIPDPCLVGWKNVALFWKPHVCIHAILDPPMMCIHACLHVRIYVCIYLAAHCLLQSKRTDQSVPILLCLSLCLSVCLFVCQSAYISTCLSVCLNVLQSVSLPTCLCISLFVLLYICDLCRGFLHSVDFSLRQRFPKCVLRNPWVPRWEDKGSVRKWN